jgi:tRNA(fMet)-specific endonuclease VapC
MTLEKLNPGNPVYLVKLIGDEVSSPSLLLDTNICIYIAKRNPPEVRRRFEPLPKDDIAMSAITFGELRYGAEKSQAREKSLAMLERLASAIQVLALPPEAGAHYGQIRAALEKTGCPIGNNDLWIAAHARAADLILVTNNAREFIRVEGLRVENWVS